MIDNAFKLCIMKNKPDILWFSIVIINQHFEDFRHYPLEQSQIFSKPWNGEKRDSWVEAVFSGDVLEYNIFLWINKTLVSGMHIFMEH